MINQFLLPGDKVLSEIHLRQPSFTCIASGPLIKNIERIQNLKKMYIQNIFIETTKQSVFLTWYDDFKDLPKITACHKVFNDKAFDIVKNPKYNGYQRGFTSMICKFVDKNFAATQIETGINPNSNSQN